ncbi:hypothetical protein [Halosimplex amylolyticum]|uniref:hypothetical protein n=1 Tax=Halosimplex amylolyticum TaxID=3396616 RepID=UPI003F57E238
MSRTGIGSRLVATVSAEVLRVVGLLTALLSAGVAGVSVSTEYGLAVTAEAGSQTAASVADVSTVGALVEFAAAHPAYPAAVLVGVVLVVAGDETPVLGS